MEKGTTMGPICQSCGLPLMRSTEFGTEAHGVINPKWCIYCYRKGKLTEPDITFDQMLAKTAKNIADNRGIPEDMARRQAGNLLRKLERWRVEDIEAEDE